MIDNVTVLSVFRMLQYILGVEKLECMIQVISASVILMQSIGLKVKKRCTANSAMYQSAGVTVPTRDCHSDYSCKLEYMCTG